MNGSGARPSGASDAYRFRESEDAGSDERAREEAAALWATLSEKVRQRPQSLPSLELPSAWRGSAGDLTPGAHVTPGPSSEASAPSTDERMVVRIDGGQLGELEVTLARDEQGVRVVIGLQTEQLAQQIAPDASSLRAALERAGMTVRSLDFVPTSHVGIVLARGKASAMSQKGDAGHPSATHDSEEARKRTHKRLTVIG